MHYFTYPGKYVRKHGPTGYTDYSSYKDWLRDEFSFRCIYCLIRETWVPNGDGFFTVEHLLPKSSHEADECNYENLFYCCTRCNSNKGIKDFPYSPCEFDFSKHISIDINGKVKSLSKEGDVIISIFFLEDSQLTNFRETMINALETLKTENINTYNKLLRFPEDLPDLKSKRPVGNTRPDGIRECYFEQKLKGYLPNTY